MSEERELDLAWIIHGVVIGGGIFKLAEAKELFQVICLVFALLIAIMDWYSFYKIERKIVGMRIDGKKMKYHRELLITDYLILGVFALLFHASVNENMELKFASVKVDYCFLFAILSFLFFVWWIIFLLIFRKIICRWCRICFYILKNLLSCIIFAVLSEGNEMLSGPLAVFLTLSVVALSFILPKEMEIVLEIPAYQFYVLHLFYVLALFLLALMVMYCNISEIKVVLGLSAAVLFLLGEIHVALYVDKLFS